MMLKEVHFWVFDHKSRGVFRYERQWPLLTKSYLVVFLYLGMTAKKCLIYISCALISLIDSIPTWVKTWCWQLLSPDERVPWLSLFQLQSSIQGKHSLAQHSQVTILGLISSDPVGGAMEEHSSSCGNHVSKAGWRTSGYCGQYTC